MAKGRIPRPADGESRPSVRVTPLNPDLVDRLVLLLLREISKSSALVVERMHVHLPVECWQEILQEAIFVPIFFDQDPAETNGIRSLAAYADTAPYWESERTRNTLRRVCSSWNTFLKSFDHRFVHTPDIIHRLVPISALENAIRVNLGCCTSFCDECRTYWASSFYRLPHKRCTDSRHSQMSLFTIFATTRLCSGVRVLSVCGGAYDQKAAIPWSQVKFPNIRSLVSTIELVDVFLPKRALPLTFCRGCPGRAVEYGAITLQNITTLDLYVHDPLLICMPSLRHLRIKTRSGWDDPNMNNTGELFNSLKIIGAQLRTFKWVEAPLGPVEGISLRRDFWKHCPNIKDVQLPMKYKWLPPPHGHPVQHVWGRRTCYSGGRQCPVCGGRQYARSQYIRHLPKLAASGIRSITLFGGAYPLTQPLFLGDLDGGDHHQCLSQLVRSYGIQLFDSQGLTVEDRIIMALENCRRGARNIIFRDAILF